MSRQGEDEGEEEEEEEGRAGSFLARWSRRKQEGAKPAPPAPAPPAQEAAGQDRAKQEPAEPDVAEPVSAEQAEAAREALLAELPQLGSIEATTDIRGFLDTRVPEGLRLAALRRAWASDPSVRDYLDPARDYALDYNTPGAAPGYGLISESQRAEMGDFARATFSDAPAVPGQPPASTAESPARTHHAALQQNHGPAAEEAEPHPALNSSNVNVFEDLSGSPQPLSDPGVGAAMQKEERDEEAIPSEPVRKRQRGGGAMPV